MVTKYTTGDVVLVPVELDSVKKHDDMILYTPDIQEDMGDRLFDEANIAGLRESGNSIYTSDEIARALDVLSYLKENLTGRYTFYPLTVEQREAIDVLWSDLHSRRPLDDNNLFKPGSYVPKDAPVCACQLSTKPGDGKFATARSGTWQKALLRVICTHLTRCGKNPPLEVSLPYEAVIALRDSLENGLL